jgi:ubiquinone/menaquinone biosynthesis C-methylase UbiE
MTAFSTAVTLAAEPFDSYAESYDSAFSDSWVGRAQRRIVWEEADNLFASGQHILEINCGTGVDALHLAERGVSVMACDASPAMIRVAQRRIESAEAGKQVQLKVLPTESLSALSDGILFDGALSNFAGMNCVADLRGVARNLAHLLKPQAAVLACIFGRFCMWEMLWHLGCGRPRKAFRRLQRETDAPLVGGTRVRVYYHSFRQLVKSFGPYFILERWRGVGVAIPPSYLNGIAERFSSVFRVATWLEPRLGKTQVFRSVADHLLVIFRRKG